MVRGLDPDGEERVYTTEGFEARAIQHELDHLDGLLILDRVRSAPAIYPRKTYR
ncbi:MAG: peptide deformylase [Actinomycetota bacterium]